jgi:hypothetical protein
MLIILFLDISILTSSPSASALSTSKSGAKIEIGVGVAFVVVLLALGLGWFVLRHRRKIRRENNDGSSLEHVSTIHEIGHTSKPPEKSSLTPISTPREIDGTEVQTRNELDSAASPRSTELGTGAENWPQESSSPASRLHIQQKPASPEHSSFPPPWATSLHHGNYERQEHFEIGSITRGDKKY